MKRLENNFSENNVGKVALIRIPKNASRSMASSLGLHLPGAHYPAQMLRESDPARFSTSTKVACIRNPFERMVVWYEFHCGTQPGGMYNGTGIEKFRGWVARACPHRFWMGHWASHPYEQWRWICNAEKEILVDKVLRYENFAAEWEKEIQIPFKLEPLPKINMTPVNSWGSYYDKATLARVEAIVYNDLGILGYEVPKLRDLADRPGACAIKKL